ncbi:hypothetical protein PYCC9005_001361 [Savitreella phatthalungensis]
MTSSEEHEQRLPLYRRDEKADLIAQEEQHVSSEASSSRRSARRPRLAIVTLGAAALATYGVCHYTGATPSFESMYSPFPGHWYGDDGSVPGHHGNGFRHPEYPYPPPRPPHHGHGDHPPPPPPHHGGPPPPPGGHGRCGGGRRGGRGGRGGRGRGGKDHDGEPGRGHGRRPGPPGPHPPHHHPGPPPGAGPFYVPHQLVRSDFATGDLAYNNTALELDIRVVDAETGDAIEGVAVDIWHADGNSQFPGLPPLPPPPHHRGPPPPPPHDDEHERHGRDAEHRGSASRRGGHDDMPRRRPGRDDHRGPHPRPPHSHGPLPLRGVQFTDSDGQTHFQSIVPGLAPCGPPNHRDAPPHENLRRRSPDAEDEEAEHKCAEKRPIFFKLHAAGTTVSEEDATFVGTPEGPRGEVGHGLIDIGGKKARVIVPKHEDAAEAEVTTAKKNGGVKVAVTIKVDKAQVDAIRAGKGDHSPPHGDHPPAPPLDEDEEQDEIEEDEFTESGDDVEGEDEDEDEDEDDDEIEVVSLEDLD